MTKPTSFQRVAAWNEDFGNPQGDYQNINVDKLRSQCHNIGHELAELLDALGANPGSVAAIVREIDQVNFNNWPVVNTIDPIKARDALCDIQVFAMGGQHMMGVDGDADMHAVVDALDTRFVKNEDDLEATIKMHAARGVTETYSEGEFPRMVLKSSSDQPDAPKGKVLKSASSKPTTFPVPRAKSKKALGTKKPSETV